MLYLLLCKNNGGEQEIRTLDAFRHTHFPGVLLRPLGQLTKTVYLIKLDKNVAQSKSARMVMLPLGKIKIFYALMRLNLVLIKPFKPPF